jgi:hypothetical protein
VELHAWSCLLHFVEHGAWISWSGVCGDLPLKCGAWSRAACSTAPRGAVELHVELHCGVLQYHPTTCRDVQYFNTFLVLQYCNSSEEIVISTAGTCTCCKLSDNSENAHSKPDCAEREFAAVGQISQVQRRGTKCHCGTAQICRR